MTHCRLSRFAAATLVLSAFAGGASGAEIFKWIDDDGVVHYSDKKPTHPDGFETLRLESTNAADYDPVADPYSILNQAARVSDARAQTLSETREPDREAVPDDYVDWGYVDYARSWYPDYVVPVYFPRPRPPFLRPEHHAPGAARRQVDALESLNVPAQRPHSINSGAHRDWVQQSRGLPLATPGGGARPR